MAKLVLAYSGGLDTSVILHWLRTKKHFDVIAFAADLGQGDDLKRTAKRALATGAAAIFVEDPSLDPYALLFPSSKTKPPRSHA